MQQFKNKKKKDKLTELLSNTLLRVHSHRTLDFLFFLKLNIRTGPRTN